MKLVILDRDGTINHPSDEYIKSPEEWRALPGALEAISRLNHAGYHVVIATNQSGLGRGLMDVAAVNAIHKRMNKQLAAVGGRVDAIFYGPHAPTDACNCRKPMPGLLEQIAERFGIEIKLLAALGVAAGAKSEEVFEPCALAGECGGAQPTYVPSSGRTGSL